MKTEFARYTLFPLSNEKKIINQNHILRESDHDTRVVDMVPDLEQRSVSDNAQYLTRYLRTLYTFRVCLLVRVPLESSGVLCWTGSLWESPL